MKESAETNGSNAFRNAYACKASTLIKGIAEYRNDALSDIN